MFKPLSLYIGLRYTRAKRRNQFISFISLISMLGIAIGVTILITVLSVMNGFDQQIRHRIFTMAPHITVNGDNGAIPNWRPLEQRLENTPKVKSVVPYISGQGLLSEGGEIKPVAVMGIIPSHKGSIGTLSSKMESGKLTSLKPGKFNIVLGDELAGDLGVQVGDKVNLVTSQLTVTPAGVFPHFKRFKVTGIFNVGTGFGFDSTYAFIQMRDAQMLYGLRNKVSGLQVMIGDLFAADTVSADIDKHLNYKYEVNSWTKQYGAFYRAVQMEKTIMFFILLLLVAIAAFNLVSGLIMLVDEKRADIAILRTFGATPRLVMSVFVVQGLFVGIIGTLLGVIGGIVLSLNVTALVNFVQNTLHVQLLTHGVYFVDYLPSVLLSGDVIKVVIVAVAMSFVSTIYPAWRASRVEPIEALRYE